MANHIKKDDMVEIISGAHRGERGKVLRILPRRQLVIVEGVNMVFRHVRPSRRNPQGGRLQKEAPIHVSNVLPVDPRANRGSRVRFEVELNSAGKVDAKRRVTVKGSMLSQLRGAGR